MPTESTPYLPVNHVFVDLENVKTVDPSVVGGKHMIFYLFIGPQNKALSAGAVKVLANLRKTGKNRPKKETTLVSNVQNSLGKDIPEEQAKRVVEELMKARHLAIDDKGAVSYQV